MSPSWCALFCAVVGMYNSKLDWFEYRLDWFEYLCYKYYIIAYYILYISLTLSVRILSLGHLLLLYERTIVRWKD